MTVSAQKVDEKYNLLMYIMYMLFMCAFTSHIKPEVIKRREIVDVHIRIAVKPVRWFYR